ncbi:MAG TPA: carboxypeptidase-like regulatory domain-containing protein [Gemmatimonadaceae bacterium]|jgi:hypothetical protein|nr:carboxypeptidase-like regulatory domain-containing protein [Gemmatimonadaceae bacterium]
MHFRSILIVAAIASAALTAGAQDVRVEVVEAATGRPIVGANVALFDSSGMFPLGGGFSDQSGRTDLRAPASGPYRVRADKVGFDTWTSVQLHLGDRPVIVRAGMAPTRAPAPVVMRSESACQQMGGPGTPAGDIWVQLKKALTANAMTEAQGLVPLDVDLYERVLDRNLGIVSERGEQRNRISRRPLTGISWDQLDSTRRGDGGSNEVYRAPDAGTLVSDQFVKSHCYTAIRGYGQDAGLTGLEFRPARIAGPADLTGVLWLDPKSNALRSLNFDYVNLPIPLRIARTTGRLEFEQLPDGRWIVPRWYIRMPRVARVSTNELGAPTAPHDSLVGYQEVGGAARPAGSARPAGAAGGAAVGGGRTSGSGAAASGAKEGTGDSPADANQSSIVGIVFDSSSGRGIPGVQVWSGGGRYRTVTNSAGRYELAIETPFTDSIVFEHPRLRLFHVADRVQSISVLPGTRGQASIILPSYGTLRTQLCGRNETGTEAQGFVAGYVRDAAGKPVPRAHVWATWQILWVEQNGRLVSTNQQRTVETDTNSDGSYLMCGFTRGAQATVKISIAGRPTVQDKLVLPESQVLEKDFFLR